MKVYVVVEGVNYEGYLAPNSAFDSREAAEKRKAELLKEDDFLIDEVAIFELELNK